MWKALICKHIIMSCDYVSVNFYIITGFRIIVEGILFYAFLCIIYFQHVIRTVTGKFVSVRRWQVEHTTYSNMLAGVFVFTLNVTGVTQ